jgi:putative transposase
MVRVFRYRLYPTPAQDRAMREQLALCCELYNAALQERREAYRKTGKGRTYSQQSADLKEIRELRPEYAAVFFHLLQDVLRRVDRAFQSFFRRVKAGERPGYPRFKRGGRYQTFVYPDGAKVVAGNKRLRLPGIGSVKIKLHRPLKGDHGSTLVTLDSDGHWYAALTCRDVPTHPRQATGRDVGVDVGLATFAATTAGVAKAIPNPRLLKAARVDLLRAQRRVSRCQRGSKRRCKAVALLAKHHARLRHARRDFQYKTACRLVRRYDRIFIEDLKIKGLAGGWLAGSIYDAAWAQFARILTSKAEEAGCEVVRVDPRGTSQECSVCGADVPKTLAVRMHRCPHCGLVVNRDVNAAWNILRRGRRRQGAVPVGACKDLRIPNLGQSARSGSRHNHL